MDHFAPPGDPAGPHAPRLHRAGEDALPADFVPLRLLLQPGGLCVELAKTDNLVGRHSEADVRLALPDISRRHCRFSFNEGGWRVTDLNSLNGTFVNDVRLQHSPVSNGDRVRLAGLTFLVELPTAAGSVPLPTLQGNARASVLKSIADVLPSSDPERRKAS
jgi:pSer/pThr/pTyr-binding forkhead associated (FHA) protein